MMLGFGFLGTLLFGSAILILLRGSGAWAFGRTTGTRQEDRQHMRTARQLLDGRFVRGEIGVAEYEAIRARISQ